MEGFLDGVATTFREDFEVWVVALLVGIYFKSPSSSVISRQLREIRAEIRRSRWEP